MSGKELALNDREELFIQILVENGGKVKEAAEEAGYDHKYAYVVRKKLSKHIAEAASHYLAIQSVKAAKKVVDTMDSDMPNPVHLQAATAILDRAGVIKKDPNEGQVNVQRANIFILPEKKSIEEYLVIDNERS
jgi:hypothetical protein